jgi:CRISPR-associated protein Cas2
MPTGKVQLHLLAYDIADPDRLVRVHRTVRRYGAPLQYSVFLIPGTSTAVDALLSELQHLIDEQEDDIRVYPLPARLDLVHYGRQWMPDGVQLIGEDSFGEPFAQASDAAIADSS